MSKFGSLLQNITASTLNSSTANLANGATFSGVVDSTLGVAGIQVSLYTDQNCTIYIEQSPDTTPTGPHWDLSDEYRYFADTNFGVTVQAISSYFRVRVTNTGSSITNYFRLQSRLCPIVEAVPRTLTDFGNFKTAVVENVASVSTPNCKTDLTGSQAWEGTFVESYNQSAIQVIAKFSQDFTLYIDQSQIESPVTPCITDSWECLANTGSTFVVASVAPYFRLRLTNKSTSAATGMATIAATAIFNPLPRKLDDYGHLQTSIAHIEGPMGKDVTVSPMGGLRTATAIKLAGHSFVGTVLDTNFWAFVHTNAASSAQANGSLTLSTGTTANAGELVNSIRIARYIAASPNYYRGNVRLPAVTTGTAGYINTRRWGAFDATNGYFFKAVQTNPEVIPTLSVVCRKTSSDTNTIANGAFNGDYGPSYALDNNTHTYEIYWTNKNAYFFLDNKLLHTFSGPLATLVDTPSLKIGLENVNSGNNNANNTLVVRSSTINRLGITESRPTFKNYAGILAATVIKYGAGTLYKVIVNKAGTSVTLNDDITATTPSNPIATIDTNKTTGGIGTYTYDLDFYNGLVIAIAGSGSDVTITYE